MSHGTRHSLCKMMEEEGASMACIKGTASIESEPKTLSFHQIKLAREAALCVMNMSTMEEALRIFTEGLKPVSSCGNRLDPEEKLYDDDCDERLLPSSRDAVSAPF